MASLTLGGDWVFCDSDARAQSAILWSDSQHSKHKISAAADLSLMCCQYGGLYFCPLYSGTPVARSDPPPIASILSCKLHNYLGIGHELFCSEASV